MITKKNKPYYVIKSSVIGSLGTGLIISIASLYAITANAAPIYKVVDERTGQVTFTDSLQAYEQQAGKQISQTGVTTGNSSTSQANANNNPQTTDNQSSSTPVATPLATSQSTPPAMSETTKRAPINYQLAMTEPSAERAYQRPAQTIVVKVQTQPALQKGDYLLLTLDGQQIGQGLSASVSTVDILPGQHSVGAVIKNQAGQTLQQIQRTIYVIQNTNILKQKQQLAAQMQAYQRLPWQQKLLLKLRQKDNSTNANSSKANSKASKNASK